ncbi:DsbA family protein [Bartonella ancashensis]|uniref:Outer membrane protein n=1 Tax=Bartonella ancashensis TaxID=1318743 RepID=A0A0M5KX44_9HYPH|nr:DsbA family protein [Bartonella ancashensis]ALE03836.1 Outer membrane protein [Bartonella ancashensis]
MIYQLQYLVVKSGVVFLVLALLGTSSVLDAKEKNPNSTLKNLEAQILEDPDFLSELSKKIMLNIDNRYIQNTIRNYLLQNPEIMIEMQLILQKKVDKQNITSLKEEIFHSPHDAIIGNPNGKIVLVEFFDYNCGYCKRSYSNIASLIKKYPDLKMIIKDLPILGPDSMAAHAVAYAFRKQFPHKYAQFHEKLVRDKGRTNEEKAMKIAISLGANEQSLRRIMQNSNLKEIFKENIQISSALNITGTPSYIIGDTVFVGAVENADLEKIIENVQGDVSFN